MAVPGLVGPDQMGPMLGDPLLAKQLGDVFGQKNDLMIQYLYGQNVAYPSMGMMQAALFAGMEQLGLYNRTLLDKYEDGWHFKFAVKRIMDKAYYTYSTFQVNQAILEEAAEGTPPVLVTYQMNNYSGALTRFSIGTEDLADILATKEGLGFLKAKIQMMGSAVVSRARLLIANRVLNNYLYFIEHFDATGTAASFGARLRDLTVNRFLAGADKIGLFKLDAEVREVEARIATPVKYDMIVLPLQYKRYSAFHDDHGTTYSESGPGVESRRGVDGWDFASLGRKIYWDTFLPKGPAISEEDRRPFRRRRIVNGFFQIDAHDAGKEQASFNVPYDPYQALTVDFMDQSEGNGTWSAYGPKTRLKASVQAFIQRQVGVSTDSRGGPFWDSNRYYPNPPPDPSPYKNFHPRMLDFIHYVRDPTQRDKFGRYRYLDPLVFRSTVSHTASSSYANLYPGIRFVEATSVQPEDMFFDLTRLSGQVELQHRSVEYDLTAAKHFYNRLCQQECSGTMSEQDRLALGALLEMAEGMRGKGTIALPPGVDDAYIRETLHNVIRANIAGLATNDVARDLLRLSRSRYFMCGSLWMLESLFRNNIMTPQLSTAMAATAAAVLGVPAANAAAAAAAAVADYETKQTVFANGYRAFVKLFNAINSTFNCVLLEPDNAPMFVRRRVRDTRMLRMHAFWNAIFSGEPEYLLNTVGTGVGSRPEDASSRTQAAVDAVRHIFDLLGERRQDKIDEMLRLVREQRMMEVDDILMRTDDVVTVRIPWLIRFISNTMAAGLQLDAAPMIALPPAAGGGPAPAANILQPVQQSIQNIISAKPEKRAAYEGLTAIMDALSHQGAGRMALPGVPNRIDPDDVLPTPLVVDPALYSVVYGVNQSLTPAHMLHEALEAGNAVAPGAAANFQFAGAPRMPTFNMNPTVYDADRRDAANIRDIYPHQFYSVFYPRNGMWIPDPNTSELYWLCESFADRFAAIVARDDLPLIQRIAAICYNFVEMHPDNFEKMMTQGVPPPSASYVIFQPQITLYTLSAAWLESGGCLIMYKNPDLGRQQGFDPVHKKAVWHYTQWMNAEIPLPHKALPIPDLVGDGYVGGMDGVPIRVGYMQSGGPASYDVWFNYQNGSLMVMDCGCEFTREQMTDPFPFLGKIPRTFTENMRGRGFEDNDLATYDDAANVLPCWHYYNFIFGMESLADANVINIRYLEDHDDTHYQGLSMRLKHKQRYPTPQIFTGTGHFGNYGPELKPVMNGASLYAMHDNYPS